MPAMDRQSWTIVSTPQTVNLWVLWATMVYLRVGDELLPTDAMGVCSTATILLLAEEMYHTR